MTSLKRDTDVPYSYTSKRCYNFASHHFTFQTPNTRTHPPTNMSADQQTAIFLKDKVLAQAMTSDLTKVEGK